MKRIKIEDCSVMIISVAEPMGFKTLASFHKFVKGCKPNAKLYCNGYGVPVENILKNIERELKG